MHTLLSLAQKALEERSEIRLAIVFGSFSKNTQKKESDLDLAVASATALTPDQKVQITLCLNAALDREVDLVDLHTATGTVLREALTTGTPLFCKDTALYAQIIKRMWLNEEDFEKERRSILARMRKEAFRDR